MLVSIENIVSYVPNFLPTLIVGVGISILMSVYVYRKFVCHTYFSRRGIPGPEPHWLYGNLGQIPAVNRHLKIHEWTKKYGSVYGIYEGPTPVLVVSDTHLIEQVLVKQYSCFQGHHLSPLTPGPGDTNAPMHNLFWATGESWRRLRNATSPAFSTGKLKSYHHLLAGSQNDLMKLFSDRASSGKNFNIRNDFQLFTLDVIAKVAFSADLGAVKSRGNDNAFLALLRKAFDTGNRPTGLFRFFKVFPGLVPIGKLVTYFLFRIVKGPFSTFSKLGKVIGKIASERIESNEKKADFLQLFLNNSETSQSADSKTWLFQEDEVKRMLPLIFAAGYETTSSALSYAAYCLATNEEVQNKLFQEIYSKFPKDQTIIDSDYDTLMNKMPYLDMVVKEVLRIYPIALNVLNRFVVGETNLCGIPLDLNCRSVIVDMWSVHRNPDLWGSVDPGTFYPERFSEENSTGRPDSAFLPFGFGPRICVGKRLALYEMKMTLANLLHRFKIAPPAGGYPEGGLDEYCKDFSILVPKHGVNIQLIPRS